MKRLVKKLAQSRVFWIVLVIVIQTIVYVAAGMGKAYLHMDEAYSLSLSNYDRIQIQENEDFYNEWHDAAYYKDYLVVGEDERGDFSPVYNNQRDDVHPPLFYLLLRIGMELTPGEFTKWTGITINIVAFAVNAAFLYLIIEKLLKKEKYRETKAGILTLAAEITLASISTVMYIRMYAMLAMFITITAYLHLRLLETKKLEPKLLVGIGITALLGVLTQYYYLFALFPMFVTVVVRYAKVKRLKEMWAYIGAIGTAAVISLLVWPYSIAHMFFGYRGQGAMGNLLNFANLGMQVGVFAGILTKYGFHYMLPVLIAVMFALAVYGLKHGKKLEVGRLQDGQFTILLWTVLFFFVIASVASPFTDLRYLEGATGLVFVVVMVGLYWLIGMKMTERGRNIIMGIILAVVGILMPIVAKIEPDVEYSRFKAVVEAVEDRPGALGIYLFNPGNNRFLDDILLFTKIEESYIMQDQEYTVENFEEVFQGRDLSKGLFVFANYGYDAENREYLETLQEATGLDNLEYIFQLNSGGLYLLTDGE